MNTVDTIEAPKKQRKIGLTLQIFIAMIAGITVGLILHYLFLPAEWVKFYLQEGIFDIGGKIFINLLQMLVIPIVFVSLVCGTCNLDDSRRLGRIALKTLTLYILTTAAAVTMAVVIANLLNVGPSGQNITKTAFTAQAMPSLREMALGIIPSNPFNAFATGNILQVIIFAILFGLAITWAGAKAEGVKKLFQALDAVVMQLMHFVLQIAPYGVFCLVAKLFTTEGINFVGPLIGYFFTMIFILGLQLFGVYSLLLWLFAGLSPLRFFPKMLPAMLFAFSTSSSNASIPVVLETVQTKLGVRESVAAFIIPLGATINMDGTAIMQGVATVFIASTYHIDIGFVGYLKVILTATLASIGTAGIPSVGLITLTMVLMQVGLPVEGIALILGVDRLLDMSRTVVNISGDAAVACIVAKSEGALDLKVYNENHKTKPIVCANL